MRLLRGDGPLIKVGHRGAAALEPENTLRSFDAAIAAGVDAIEFDVFDLAGGALVLAHSNDLLEVSHGRVAGTVRDRSLEELRELAPELPTLDEALSYFVDHPGIALHVDLKLERRLDELAGAILRYGLAERTVISTFDRPSLLAISHAAPEIRVGFTYPEDRHGISRRRGMRPVIRVSLAAFRAVLARRVPAMVASTGAAALMLHHAVVSPAAVERAHGAGAAVWAWTVDRPHELAAMQAAGVDAVITNDPGIFVDSAADFPAI